MSTFVCRLVWLGWMIAAVGTFLRCTGCSGQSALTLEHSAWLEATFSLDDVHEVTETIRGDGASVLVAYDGDGQPLAVGVNVHTEEGYWTLTVLGLVLEGGDCRGPSQLREGY